MLSYQHGYHAGNFADVLKHATLTRLLAYLTAKDKPLYYLETHSGRGIYDLHDAQALKTGEAQQGIDIIWRERKKLSPIFDSYLKSIRALNPKDTLQYYPGSPKLAIDGLRQIDRLFFCELHPKEFEHLAEVRHGGKRVFYSETDGLLQLKTLPPPEKRGLIFIDPSFELKDEYKKIPQLMKSAHQHFATGVYCLWYPLIDNKLHDQLMRGLKSIEAKNHLRVEFYLNSKNPQGMDGCGLWIINPPYVLKQEVTEILDGLKKLFNPGKSAYLIQD